MEQTNRKTDLNGWLEIKGNPISKVGVFPYSGAQISRDLPPDEIFSVYRPVEELENEECINSFKLIPWTDDHEMLGSEEEGLTPAESKGVEGVIGETVYFDKNGGYLKANVKVFSEGMKSKIDKYNKKELSIGYRCTYEKEDGIFNGEPYQYVQRNIRGNHLALVDEGRSGKDVSVLDQFKFTLDNKELLTMYEKTENSDADISLEDRMAKLEEIIAKLVKSDESVHENLNEDESVEESEKAKDEDEVADSEEEEKEKEKEAAADEEEKEDKEKAEDEDEEKKGMDARLKKLEKMISRNALDSSSKNSAFKTIMKEISKRDSLASELSHHIGTFDHAEKSLDEVAKYGVKKLGITCSAGEEHAVLKGFLARGLPNQNTVASMDSHGKHKSMIETFIASGAK